MSETPAEAMRRFIEKIQPIKDFSPPYPSVEEMLDDGVSFFAPFLSNSQLHQKHIGILLEGITFMATLMTFGRIMNNPVMRFADNTMGRVMGGTVTSRVRSRISEFITELTNARTELMKGLDPGELLLDVLPP
jgi:hypothetical protein